MYVHIHSNQLECSILFYASFTHMYSIECMCMYMYMCPHIICPYTYMYIHLPSVYLQMSMSMLMTCTCKCAHEVNQLCISIHICTYPCTVMYVYIHVPRCQSSVEVGEVKDR